MKVLMEIHRDFGHYHDLLAKIILNEKPLIYYGLFPGHECSDVMGKSFGIPRFYMFVIWVSIDLVSLFFANMDWQEDLLT